jgi:hypothetical protein
VRGEIGRKPVDCRGAVGHDFQAGDAFVERSEAFELLRSEDIEGDEDVFEARGGKDFGFADLLAVDALCAGRDLRSGKRGNLVRLDMRAEIQPCSSM